MTNVLHLINTGGPGGAETVYLNLVHHLDAARWGAVPAVPDAGWLYQQVAALGTAPLVVRSEVRFDRRYLGQLLLLIRRHGVGLIHSHLFGPAVTASLLGLACGVPVVATVHGQGDLATDEPLRRLKIGLLNRGATRLVFVSEPLRRHFLHSCALRAERTTVIANGVGPEFFSTSADAALRAELGVSEGQLLVGAVGNVREAKGYDVLLRAAALLNERCPGRFRFVVAGEAKGELYERLAALRDALGLQEVVRFVGFRDDVARLLASLDLYLITSRAEGFSLSTVQAMAAARPVVATRCGGPEQILGDGDTGVLVDTDSPGQIADALVALGSDAQRRALMGAAARTAAEQRFTVERQVRTYEAVYSECLAMPRRMRVPGAAWVLGARRREQFLEPSSSVEGA